MDQDNNLIVYGAVEGDVDESALRVLLRSENIFIGGIFGKKGKDFLRNKVRNYNNAARFSNWVILVDLDQEQQCAPELVVNWLPQQSPYMFLRVVVRSIESWLLADKERIARFLVVPVRDVPDNPENLDDSKLSMINLARKSKSRAVREDMIPREGSGRKVGPAYNSRLIEFIQDSRKGWRPDVAANNADSLQRCLRVITGLRTVWYKE